MKYFKPSTVFYFCLLMSFGSLSLTASTAKRMSLSRLVQASSVIVIGTVLELNSHYNADHSIIFTEIVIAVDTALMGSTPKKIALTMLGGTVAGITTTVVGAPGFCKSEQAILFLKRFESFEDNRIQHYSLVGLSQGKYTIVPKDNKEYLTSSAHNSNLILLPDEDGITIPPGGATGITLMELVNTIKMVQVKEEDK